MEDWSIVSETTEKFNNFRLKLLSTDVIFSTIARFVGIIQILRSALIWYVQWFLWLEINVITFLNSL